MIHEIGFDPAIARQQVGHEDLREGGLRMQRADHVGFLRARHPAFGQRHRRREARRLSHQTAFAKKFAGLEDADNRFLTLLGGDDNFDLAAENVEDRVGGIALRPRRHVARRDWRGRADRRDRLVCSARQPAPRRARW